VSLVSVGEQRGFLRLADDSRDDQLQVLLDQVEALLLQQANRVDVPFKVSGEEDRVEYHSGTGGRKLWLGYPIADVTSIKLGLDPSDPDDTLDPADKTVVRWYLGTRKLDRVDGGVFGTKDVPYYVEVTYDTQADRTQDLNAARLAIVRRVAAIWRQVGLEGVESERQPDLSATPDKKLDEIPEWKAAVSLLRRMSVL
jgi:hypothetical protein